MSQELQRNDDIRMADLSAEYQEIMVLGKVLYMSGYFRDVKDQAQAVTKVLYGREFGISPVISMSAIHIIEGKPTLSANMLAALIKRSGKYDYRVKLWTDKVCVLVFKQRLDDKTWEEVGESSFTIEDAQRAGVVRAGGGWSKYPKAMLFARALSQGERTYCPDVSVCPLYVPEELGATVNEAGEVVEVPVRSQAMVEVTRTKDGIKVERPKESQGDKGPAGTEVQSPTPLPATPEPVPPALVDALVAKMAPPDETIDLPRQRALHRAFKDSIPELASAETHKNAAVIFRAWLKHETFLGPDGEGSTKGIPVLLFDEVKAKAIAYAETLR